MKLTVPAVLLDDERRARAVARMRELGLFSPDEGRLHRRAGHAAPRLAHGVAARPLRPRAAHRLAGLRRGLRAGEHGRHHPVERLPRLPVIHCREGRALVRHPRTAAAACATSTTARTTRSVRASLPGATSLRHAACRWARPTRGTPRSWTRCSAPRAAPGRPSAKRARGARGLPATMAPAAQGYRPMVRTVVFGAINVGSNPTTPATGRAALSWFRKGLTRRLEATHAHDRDCPRRRRGNAHEVPSPQGHAQAPRPPARLLGSRAPRARPVPSASWWSWGMAPTRCGAHLANEKDVECVEQAERLGTGHAVRVALEGARVTEGALLVLNGDGPARGTRDPAAPGRPRRGGRGRLGHPHLDARGPVRLRTPGV